MTKVNPKKGSFTVDVLATPRSVIDDILLLEAQKEKYASKPDPMAQAQDQFPMQPPQAVVPDDLWVDGTVDYPKPTLGYLAKPAYTPFQWLVDKFLTGEQVTTAMYRHYQQTRPNKNALMQALYPEQEFEGYRDAAKKGFLHKTEWNFMDVARYEDWFGQTYPGRVLHKTEGAAESILENPKSTPEMKKKAYKVLKQVRSDLVFGNTIVGGAAGVVLDPITYLDPSKVRHVSKLIKIPFIVAHQAVLTKILSYNKLTTRLDEINKLIFTGGKAYKLKKLENVSDAIITLRKAGVQEDLIKSLDSGVISASDIIASLRPTVDGYDEIISALARVAAGEEAVGEIAKAVVKMEKLADTAVMMEKGDSKMLAKKFLATHRLEGTYAAHKALGRSKKGRAVLDLFETASVEKIDGTWGLGEGFYRTLKNAGLSDDVLEEIVVKNRGYQTVVDPVEGAVKQTIDKLGSAPLAHELDEFQAGVEVALESINPKLRPLLDQYNFMHTDLANELIRRDLVTRETMENFARELGLSHLRHFPKKRYWEMIKKASVSKRRTMWKDAKESLDQLARDLEIAKVSKPEIEDILSAAKADMKKLSAGRRGTDQLISDSEQLSNLFRQAHEIHNAYPDIKMANILKRFRTSLGDVSGFRRIMGTINEIDDLAVDAGFKKVIETNAAEIMYRQEMLSNRAIAYHDYIERIVENFPDQVARYTDGMDLAGKVPVEDAFLGKYVVDEGFENSFKLILGMETGTGDTWNTYAKWYDWMLEKWRYYTLIPFAKFHTRNLFSEDWYNSLGGMNVADPVWMKSRKQATTLAMDAIWKKDPVALETYAHIMEQGYLGHGFFSAELGTGQNLARGGQAFPFMGREYSVPVSIRGSKFIGQKVLTKAEHIGESIEAIPRLQMYFYGLEKGPQWVHKQGFGSKFGSKLPYPPSVEGSKAFRDWTRAMKGTGLSPEDLKIASRQAAEEMSQNLAKGLKRYGVAYTSPDGLLPYVRKFHPTYDKFTPVEQKVFRRILPFYSWPRFNIPMTFEMMMARPRAYAGMERGRRLITGAMGAQYPDKDEPEWIKRGYAYGWSRSGPNRTYQLMKNWFAPLDVDDVIPIVKKNGEWKLSTRPPADKFQQMLTPIIKNPWEVFVTQRDSYTRRDIPSYPGAKKVIGGIPFTDKTIKIDERAAHLLQPIRILQEINKLFWGKHDSKWDAIIGHLFGRMYDVDINKARSGLYYSFMEQLHGRMGLNNQYEETGLIHGREIARKNKDWPTVKDLDKRIRLIEREIARLKPYVIEKKDTGRRRKRQKRSR